VLTDSFPGGGRPPSWNRLIQRKITPPALPDEVAARERVASLLTRLIGRHRLVSVCASAGAGKTTAVRQAVSLLQRPLAWLTVDGTDGATGRLLTYLEAALWPSVPGVAGVASAAMAASLPHVEVAGILAESLGDNEVVVVLDDVERLAGSPEAIDVLSSFARYLPPQARLVVLSRCALPFRSVVGSAPWVAGVGERDLALTAGEAAEVLARAGREEVDAAEAVRQTGGWMTGVLFEAWRADEHVLGLGGEADPLHGYLATEILADLEPADREFLIHTAVLPEVSVAAAESLGVAGASARLHSLLGSRLPVSWTSGNTVLRCHPRFREFLLRLLSRRDEAEQRALYRAHARMLAGDGYAEEALEEYLKAGCLEEALDISPAVLERVIERTDFDLAERWLAQLAPVRGRDDLVLAEAELLLAVAREDYGAGAALGDSLLAAGRREELAASSGQAAGLLAWCYLHVGRPDDMDAVLESGLPGAAVEAARYATLIVRDGSPRRGVPTGVLSGGPLDAMVMRTHFDLGRMNLLTDPPRSPWAVRVAESWLAGALLASGNVERAFELYHQLTGSAEQSVWLSALLGPRLLGEMSDHVGAQRLLREGRARIAATGSAMFSMYSLLMEAEFALRWDADVATAASALAQVRAHPVGRGYAFVVEQWEMLTGLTRLLEGRPQEAVVHLERAVSGMQKGNRLLFLAPAAVYLAEAHWRAGSEEASDHAADRALAAAEHQGSNHSLLQALAEFPDVLSRRIDLEPTGDSRWHQLGRSLLVRSTPVAAVTAAARSRPIHVTEFGRAAVHIDGAAVRARLSKSVELLALLATRERAEATKAVVLDSLFDSRRNGSSAAYLRQAMFRLREMVPDVLDPDSPPGILRLAPGLSVTTDSQHVLSLLSQASSTQGERRVRILQEALTAADQGEYLPGSRSPWAEDRRRHLQEMLRRARFDAAEAAFAVGRYSEAEGLTHTILAEDRFHEPAWRLRMRIAHMHGDHQRVLATYRACEQALGEIGAGPSASTVSLLRDLRV
jgi:DNA-binding SARP family transcriptional activator